MANVSKLLRLSAMLVLLSMLGSMTALAETTEPATLPSDVEGLSAVPGDSEVTLTWDAATDDGGIEGYYVYAGLVSVDQNGGSYTFGSSDAGNTTTYTMENLSNGVTYYFAVTAYDSDGNESEFYSKEVEATPESSELADYTAPTVKSATALSSGLVEVDFSEAVVLPTEPSSGFALTATDGTALEVMDAYSSDDPSIVFIVTDTQEAGQEYELTAGIGIEDESGNPVESGTSDTAYFTGSGLEKTETTETTDSSNADFKVDDVDASEINELVLTFSQAVANAEPSSFTIQQADDATVTIDVLAVSISETDSTEVTLATDDMNAGYDYVITMDDTVLNEDGESLSDDNLSAEFTAKTLEMADLIPPEDITDFIATLSTETSLVLSWTASEDSAGDLASYLLYQSTDGGVTFDDALELASSTTEHEVEDLTAGETYTFKVTAVDESGNESEGMLTTITLPESGPELLVLVPMALAGAGFVTRRKKQRF